MVDDIEVGLDVGVTVGLKDTTELRAEVLELILDEMIDIDRSPETDDKPSVIDAEPVAPRDIAAELVPEEASDPVLEGEPVALEESGTVPGLVWYPPVFDIEPVPEDERGATPELDG